MESDTVQKRIGMNRVPPDVTGTKSARVVRGLRFVGPGGAQTAGSPSAC